MHGVVVHGCSHLGDFFSMVYGYEAARDGHVNRAGSLAEYGDGDPIINDFGCVVAYMPNRDNLKNSCKSIGY